MEQNLLSLSMRIRVNVSRSCQVLCFWQGIFYMGGGILGDSEAHLFILILFLLLLIILNILLGAVYLLGIFQMVVL